MKTSSAPPPIPPARKPVTPELCAIINQLAFPGMGTVMMGKRVGYVQAAVMVVGFCLVMVYFAAVFTCSIRYINSSEWTIEGFRSCYGVYLPTLFRGLGFCAVAWVWSLFSSIAMLRRGRSNRKTPP